MNITTCLLSSGQTSYRIYGGKKGPILILHGWGGSASSWDMVAKGLCDLGYHVIVPDLPGFGDSPEPPEPWTVAHYVHWLQEFQKAIGLQQPIVLAHSFGGRIVFRSHKDMPEWARAYILTGAAGILHPKSRKVRLLSFVARRVKSLVGPLIVALPICKRLFGKLAGTRDYLDATGVMKETMLHVIREDQKPYISKIQVPTFILWGKKDTYTPVADAHTIYHLIQGSELEIVDDGRHGLHHTHPDLMISHIHTFLQKHRQG